MHTHDTSDTRLRGVRVRGRGAIHMLRGPIPMPGGTDEDTRTENGGTARMVARKGTLPAQLDGILPRRVSSWHFGHVRPAHREADPRHH